MLCLCIFCSMEVGKLKELRESKEPSIVQKLMAFSYTQRKHDGQC